MTLYTIDAWSMECNWTYNPELDNLKGTLRGYKVYYKSIDNARDPDQHSITVNTTVFSVVLADLMPYTEYEAYVLGFSMYEGIATNTSVNRTHQHGMFSAFFLFLVSVVD